MKNRLKEAFMLTSVSVQELAKNTRYNPLKIEKWRNQEFQPKLKEINKMAAVFKVSPLWLAGCNVTIDHAYSNEKPQNRLNELIKSTEDQARLSEALTITKSCISRYLNNKSQPNEDMAYRLADYFNVSVYWLLGYPVPREDITNTRIEDSYPFKIRLEDMLNKMNITMDDVSAECEIPISKLKSNKLQSDLDTLSLISSKYEVPLSWLEGFDTPDDTTFSIPNNLLDIYMEKEKLSKKDLSAMTNISTAKINAYLTQKKQPRQAELVRLAKTLNVIPVILAGYTYKVVE